MIMFEARKCGKFQRHAQVSDARKELRKEEETYDELLEELGLTSAEAAVQLRLTAPAAGPPAPLQQQSE